MGFDREQLGCDILELFFEAQRHGGIDELDEDMVILCRAAHRRFKDRERKLDGRQREYCRDPPHTEYVQCARDGCDRVLIRKVGSRGKPKRFCSQACQKREYRKGLTN